MKKFLIALLLLSVVSASGGFYYFAQLKGEKPSDPKQAIPVSAALIISYPNLSEAWELFEDKDYFDVLNGIGELRSFFARNARIDSLLRRNKDLGKMLFGNVLWSSYHHTGGDSLHVFHAIATGWANDQRALELIRNAFSGQGVVSEQIWGETSVSKVVHPDPFFVLYYTVSNGLVLASSSEELLRISLQQLKSGRSLNDDPYFLKATASAGKNVEADLYINYSRLPDYLSKYIKHGIDLFKENLSSVASWTELDINLKDDGLIFNGFSYSNDSLPQLLNLFLKQAPQTIEFPEILPSNTASFVFYGVDDLIEFSSDHRKMIEQEGELLKTEATLDSLNELYGIDLEQNLLAWMGNAFGVCITEPGSSSFTKQTYFVFRARSPELAEKLLGYLSAALSGKNGARPEVATLNGVRATKLELNGIAGALFGERFNQFESLCYMVVKGYVIFGADQRALSDFLQHVQADRTLGKELSFSEFAEDLSSTFNVFTYHHLSRSKHIFGSYLNRDALASLDESEGLLQEFEAVATQITSTGQSFYSNVFLKYNPNQQTADRSSWVANMSSPAQIPPVFVKNHVSNEWEVLAQDESNNLYLFNKVGQELFKRELPEAINSRPVQVDAFKNTKLQYVFNTENFIFMIDRNGNNVDGFPIELSAGAETDLTVVQYDSKRNYRLLITCKNKRIYSYDIKGKKIKGWKHTMASDLTVHPFLHLFTGGKDYLITGESNGKIHLLDRRGKNRVQVGKRVPSSKNNTLHAFRSSEPAFTGVYLTDETGKIHRVSLDGKVRPMDVGRFSPEHYFSVADLNRDGRPEFIFSDLNILQVFNYKKEKVFEKRLDPTASGPFLIDLGENGLGIGYCFKDPEQLVLYDNSGEMVFGFPLSGNSHFDVVGNRQVKLVVSITSNSSLTIQAIR